MSYYLNADEVFEVGLEIERNGKSFYELAAQHVSDGGVRDLCRELAEWEGRHVSAFENMRRQLPAQAREDAAFDPDSAEATYAKAMADSHVFLQGRDVADLVAGCDSTVKLLDLAISFEKDSVLFYAAMKPLVGSQRVQGSIDALIQEEEAHIATLTARKKQLGESDSVSGTA